MSTEKVWLKGFYTVDPNIIKEMFLKNIDVFFRHPFDRDRKNGSFTLMCKDKDVFINEEHDFSYNFSREIIINKKGISIRSGANATKLKLVLTKDEFEFLKIRFAL
jgi:hypothetical protein